MSTSSGIDYAKLLGFESVAAAAAFAASYVLLLGLFNELSPLIRPANAMFAHLSLFCTIRATAFTIRAVAARLDSVGHNSSFLLGDEILFNAGFFVLLYTLASNVQTASDAPVPAGIINIFLAVCWKLSVSTGMAFGIASIIQSRSINPGTVNLGKNLQKASTITSLVLTVLQTSLMLRIAWAEISIRVDADNRECGSWGVKYGCYIRCVISLLLLVREAFATAAIMNDTLAAQLLNNEHFWYPLIALPEILAVTLYVIPGVVVLSAVPVPLVDPNDVIEIATSSHTIHFGGLTRHSATVERSILVQSSPTLLNTRH
ncbi:hypothetical protein BD779DRAFT_1469480 [Infundibulicybe gibba]|nr:hypothetical protein BD779DRAFT_1469480 [Infundibulicybe gibba]